MLLYLSLVLVALSVWYFRRIYSFWESRGVPTPPYSYIVGNLGACISLKKSLGQTFTEIYNNYEGYNYVGFYRCLRPGILVRNPELIKDMLTKSFKNFHDNDIEVDEKVDMILGKNPFVLNGERWKIVRNQITPVFSASKVKGMMGFLEANANKMIKYLEKHAIGALEAKELCSKFTCENVASCAFGLEGQCFADEKAEFRENGRQLTEPGTWTGVKQMMVFVLPFISKIANIKFTPDCVTTFFKQLVKQTLSYRQKESIIRGDFLDIMQELKRKINNEKEFNEDDIVSHVGGFFVDGYETSSIALSYILYELAAHPDIQTRLREEIKDALQNNTTITYEAINEMKYLDCVIKETLRKNVPLLVLQKKCTETYTLPALMENNTGPSPTIPPGTPVIIPVDALHMDPKYFPEPEEFNPDRFSDENNNFPKFAYLPFGEGPRMCLGLKFGNLQVKIGIVAIINNYKISVNNKTQEPLKTDPKNFMRSPIGKIWLNFSKNV